MGGKHIENKNGGYAAAFGLLCAGYFALWLAQGMNGSTAALCAGALGAGEGGKAASAALFFAGAALSRPAAGFFADRGRAVFAAWAGTAMYLAAALAGALAAGAGEGGASLAALGAFVAVRFFQGFGCCAAQTAMLALAAEHAQGAGRGVSLIGLGQALALGLSAMLALDILCLPGGVGRLYIWSSAAVGAALALELLAGAGFKRAGGKKPPAPPPGGFPLTLKAAPPAAIQLAAGMAGVSCLSYMTVFSSARGLDGGVFFVAAAAAMLPARFAAGRLCGRFGELRLTPPAALVSALGLALLPAARGGLALAVSAALYGAGVGVTQPMLNAAAVKSGGRRGASTATFMLGADVGLMLGAAVWGGTMGGRGFEYIFTSAALLMAAAGAAAAILSRRQKRRGGGK